MGEWLLQEEELVSCDTGSEGGGSGNAVLVCYGDLGIGKVYIR